MYEKRSKWRWVQATSYLPVCESCANAYDAAIKEWEGPIWDRYWRNTPKRRRILASNTSVNPTTPDSE